MWESTRNFGKSAVAQPGIILAAAKRHRKRVIVASVVVLGLGAGAVFGLRPAKEAFHAWRARQLLEDVREFVEERNWSEARRASLASYQLQPSVDAVRLYFTGHLDGHPDILNAALALARHPEANGGDHATALAVFLDVPEYVGARQIIDNLDNAQLDDPRVKFQRVRYHLAFSHFDRAIELADSIPLDQRTYEVDYLLARRFLGHGEESVRAEAFARLEKVLADPNPEGAVRVLRLLTAIPDNRIEPELLQQIADRFEGADMGVVDQLSLWQLKLALLKGDQRKPVIETAVARFLHSNPELLLEWLLKIGETDRVAQMTETIDATPATFRIRNRALLKLERYDQLLGELEDPPEGVRGVDVYSLQAVVSHLAKRPSHETGRLWDQAFSAARENSDENTHGRIVALAHSVGATDRMMEALARQVEHPKGIPPRLDQLSGLFEWLAKRDPDRYLTIAKKLLQRERENPGMTNNYYYMFCLHRIPTKGMVEALERMIERYPLEDYPEAKAFYGTLALAHLRTGAPDQAIRTLDSANASPETLSESDRAIYAAGLSALDRHFRGRDSESQDRLGEDGRAGGRGVEKIAHWVRRVRDHCGINHERK